MKGWIWTGVFLDVGEESVFLYFLDNMIGFETAERLLQYLKDSNTWEQ